MAHSVVALTSSSFGQGTPTQAAWQQISSPQAAIQAVVGETGAVEVVISAAEGEAEVAVAVIEVIDAEAD